MKDVQTITAHPFGDGLLVEIIGVDEHGDVTTATVEFDRVESESEAVTPRGEIPPAFEEEVCATLSERGYSIVENVAG